MVTIVNGIISIVTNPEQMVYLSGSILSPVAANQMLPSTEGWPWWGSFLLSVGWLGLAWARSYWKHKKNMKKKDEESPD